MNRVNNNIVFLLTILMCCISCLSHEQHERNIDQLDPDSEEYHAKQMDNRK
jgi:hypothetical protein